MKKTIGIAMVAALLAGAGMDVTAGQATESGDGEVAKLTVRFDDLDLRRPAGIAMLHSRLRAAARHVCAGFDANLRGAAAAKKCRTSALERAVSELPAAVHTYHANWVAAGSKYSSRPEHVRARQLAARR